ncbi:hypothetical protein [Tolypothrix sp. NIES-4075]|uniref:hypothetical protein n=1 Tax=Tolypothrix sp. NIES-4075 TaxID=2005459 RepID=UPI00117FEEA1|nr:hypothetical protein [Tolypothrix sp. NIES-4075]
MISLIKLFNFPNLDDKQYCRHPPKGYTQGKGERGTRGTRRRNISSFLPITDYRLPMPNAQKC